MRQIPPAECNALNCRLGEIKMLRSTLVFLASNEKFLFPFPSKDFTLNKSSGIFRLLFIISFFQIFISQKSHRLWINRIIFQAEFIVCILFSSDFSWSQIQNFHHNNFIMWWKFVKEAYHSIPRKCKYLNVAYALSRRSASEKFALLHPEIRQKKKSSWKTKIRGTCKTLD